MFFIPNLIIFDTMITNREFVARIVNNLKANTKDDHISRRFILSIGQIKAKFLIAQKLDEMTLFREEGIISHIDCFEMKRVKAVACGVIEFQGCKTIMQSVKKLPTGVFGKNGSGIVAVRTADGSRLLDYISPKDFIGLSKRKYVYNTNDYYTIKGDHLFLPNSELEILSISLITLNKWEVAEASSCCTKEQICASRWDAEFVCPDRFLDIVHRDTLQEVASIYRTSVIDENPNLDENQKTQTQA